MGRCEPQSPMNGRGGEVTVCPRTALGRFKQAWCLQPISSKELAAVRPQSRSELSPVSWHGRLRSSLQGTNTSQAAQAGGQAGSKMDDMCPPTAGRRSASSGRPSWQGQNFTRKLREPCANKAKAGLW